MRISKTLVAFCAIALCAVLIGNAATDTEAQAKAREALRKKLAAEGQTTPESPAAAPVAPVPPARRVAPAPGQEDKLREALRQKIQELNQQESGGVTPAATAVPPAPVSPPLPVVPPATVVVTPSSAATAPSPADPSGNEEQLRQATRQKIQELNQTGDVGAATSGSKASDEQVELMRQRLRETIAAEHAREQAARLAVPVQPIATDAAGQSRLAAEADARREAERAATRTIVEEQRRAEAAANAEAERQAAARKKSPTEASPQSGAAGFAPIVAPPSSLPSSKEARLTELTRRYKADEMTPEEYHKERAKLIAEP